MIWSVVGLSLSQEREPHAKHLEATKWNAAIINVISDLYERDTSSFWRIKLILELEKKIYITHRS